MLVWMAAALAAEDATAAAPAAAATPAEVAPAGAAPAGATPAEATPSGSEGSLVLFPLRAVNLPDADVAAAEALLRAHFAEVSSRPLLSAEATLPALGAQSTDAALSEACGRLACAEFVTLDLVRLGEEVYVTAVAHAPDGAPLHRVDVVAPGVPALNGALHRIADALTRRVPFEAATFAHGYVPVDAPEAAGRPVGVRPSVWQGFRTGAWVPAASGAGPALTVAWDGRWERGAWFLHADTGVALPTDTAAPTGGVFVDVGLSRYLSFADGRTLYVGAGLGPRLAAYGSGTGGVGLGAYGEAGIQASLAPAVRAYAEVRGGIDTFTVFDAGIVPLLALAGGFAF